VPRRSLGLPQQPIDPLDLRCYGPATVKLQPIAAIALALLVVGCASEGSSGSAAPADLAASPTPDLSAGELVELPTGILGCYLMKFPIWGRFLPDPVLGVTVDGTPIIFPVGYTGRLQSGSGEVDVLNAEGKVVATTGNDYWLPNGPMGIYAGPQAGRDGFPACGIRDATPELIARGDGSSFSAERASERATRDAEERRIGLVLRDTSAWCDPAARPDWCKWVRRDDAREVVAKIEEDTLKVGVRDGTPFDVAEKLCGDVAADENVLPDDWVGSRNKTEHVYSVVDVEAVGEEMGYGPIGMDWFADGIKQDGSPGFRVHRLAKCSVPWEASPSPS
jgi:hypothetical protein